MDGAGAVGTCKLLPRTRRRCVRDTFGCDGIDLPSSQMRRALLAFGPESVSEDRAREQGRRVADPSSQPQASHRSICAVWPDEGSAQEVAYSDGDRSHTKGHA